MFRAFGNPSLDRIFRQMSSQRRLQLFLLLGVLLLGSLSELFAIAAILPFLSLLTGSGSFDFSATRYVFDLLGATSPQDRIVVAAGIFAAAAIIAGGFRIALAWMTQSFSFGLGHDLEIAIQTRLLYQPYAYHSVTSSSDIIAAHEKVSNLIYNVVLPGLFGATAAVTSLFIIAILTYIDLLAAAVAVVGVGLFYVAVTLFTRVRLERFGSIINSTHALKIRALQESMGGIRDVLIDHSQSVHLSRFERISDRLRRAEVRSSFISVTPRFAVEAAGMVLIAILAILLSSRSESYATALPVLGAIALSAQRLLPLLQQVYQGLAQVRIGSASASDIAALLELRIAPELAGASVDPLPFHKEIRLKNVGFRYSGRREWALRDIDLTIPRGSRIALVGRTGSGKSTLADLLMGLLDPSEGRVSIDGIPLNNETKTAWQAQIAHVPQAIFLADASIAQNIAFGRFSDEIDMGRVRDAARIAQADEFIDALPDKYDTAAGERGVRLSGGQRQRIGIARALYKGAQMLIFDEATSALDGETESTVFDAIAGIGREITLVVIAHREASIAHCDSVVRLERGRIIRTDRQPDIEAERHFG